MYMDTHFFKWHLIYLKFYFLCCSVIKPCPILRDPMDCSTHVPHHRLEFAQVFRMHSHHYHSEDFFFLDNLFS